MWTFKLRQGVTFHDGTPTDRRGRRLLAEPPQGCEAIGSRANALAAPMKEIKATGKHEVTITLEAPNADLPVMLGTWHFFIIKNGTTEFTTAIGTGPYKLKEFTPGIRTIGVRNPNYFKPGKPYIDEIELIGIPDETARVNALAVRRRPPDRRRSTRARSARSRPRPAIRVFETKAGYYTDLVMRQDADPTRNPDFVLALKHLFNREEIEERRVPRLCRGRQRPADRPDQPLLLQGSLPQRPFDPDKAKFHFQKSGIGNTPVELYTSPAAPGSVEMGVLLQEAAEKIGLNIDLKQVPADGYWSNYWMKKPLGFGAINPRPSADILLTLFFKSDANWNESAWKNEKFDQLLVAARGEATKPSARQIYGDMQALVRDHCGIGIPVFINAARRAFGQAQGPEADSGRRLHGQRLRRARLARGLTHAGRAAR